MTVIDRINVRLNVGLEDSKTLEAYAAFFKRIQKAIGDETEDSVIAAKISTLFKEPDIVKKMKKLTIK